MPARNDSSSAKANQSAARQQAERRWAEVYEHCRRDMIDAIREGDHAGAWEMICDGPDVARAEIRSDGRLRMSEALRDVARRNGWDEDGSRAEMLARMADYGRVAQHMNAAGSGGKP